MGKSKPVSTKPEFTVTELISYRLSDPEYIASKWTKLPPVTPTAHCSWTKPWQCFKKREQEKILYYPKGQLAAMFNTNGTGKIFYTDGRPAIELSESQLGYQRILLYSATSHGESRSLGWLDSFGNCVINDVKGNVVATYNQTGGVIFGKDHFWKWEWSELLKRIKAEGVKTVNVKKSRVYGSGSKRSVSEQLLQLHILNSPGIKTFKIQGGKIYFQCEVNSAISLWISNQDKIDLSFSSNSFITRLDVGVIMSDEPISEVHKRHSIFLSALARKASGKIPTQRHRLK